LIDPPAAFQQRREERPGAQLRDPQLQIPGRRGQGPDAVAVGLIGTLARAGADRVGELGFDQCLVDGLGGVTDTITDIGDL
jgi:hypothetical protein